MSKCRQDRIRREGRAPKKHFAGQAGTAQPATLRADPKRKAGAEQLSAQPDPPWAFPPYTPGTRDDDGARNRRNRGGETRNSRRPWRQRPPRKTGRLGSCGPPECSTRSCYSVGRTRSTTSFNDENMLSKRNPPVNGKCVSLGITDRRAGSSNFHLKRSSCAPAV